jgi:hypothetical protein
MVRPEDFERLFPGGLPSWIEKPETEKRQADSLCFIEKPKLADVSIDGMVAFTSKLGVDGTSRMYGFFKEDPARMPSQNARPYEALAFADDMAPIGKHPGIKSRPVAKGLWCADGYIEPGTIIKVFVGYTNETTYGMYFFAADVYAERVRISHPAGNTFIEGKLTEIQQGMYAELGLRKLPSRAKGIPINIREV